VKYFLLIIILFVGIVFYKVLSVPSIKLSPILITPTITQSLNNLAYPIAEFKKRLTKKFFGTYVTPQNSPIYPEKFTGFHTGVDVEYGDITTDVPVYSIADGEVIYSGYVSGYGGFIAIQYPQYIGIYGHLKPSSLIVNKSIVKKGDKIAVLGQAYSTETDGERRHLHFAILKGTKLDFRGYVQNQSELSLWIDPLTLYP
jgi:murein DD-endopeptidase MepM/ murein hydrolase activator NlpD